MNKTMMIFLVGAGVLIGISEHISGADNLPVYAIAALISVVPLLIVFLRLAGRKRDESEVQALELLRDAQKVKIAQNDVKSKIPKNSPRRESTAAFEGSAKLGVARSMAVLVRKPRLRGKILEICDFADLVLETIRRMPADTPAAVAFAENHLSKLNEALERCFEMNRNDEYKNAPESLDKQEIECFSTFITAFRKQQENILAEGRNF